MRLMKRHLLRVYELESRLTPAVYTVDNTNDSGTGSLRQAIDDSNMLTIGSDVISFSTASGAFTSANPGTIALLTALPTIDEDLAIIGLGSSVCIIQGMELHPCSGPVL